jgi:hypothetical protein
MNEQYLHLLWRTKRLPLHLLKTIDGRDIRILHVGFYNTASGPDFFNGSIALDGLRHNGNIELHVKSSDWYAHGHQHDDAYNNVILHVVYEHDKLVFIEGIPIPTLELKQFIDEEHFRQTMSMVRQETPIPCAAQLGDCPPPVIWNAVETALFRRLERKQQEIASLAVQLQGDPRLVLFHTIAQAFGMKTNRLPFQELAHRLPFERLIRSEKRQIESIVFGTGGFLENVSADRYERELAAEWSYQSARLQLHAAQAYAWHFKGCRPPGFPTLRLAQFAAFIDRMDWSDAFWELPAAELKNRIEEALTAMPSDYWTQHYHFGKRRSEGNAAMGLSTARVILLNSIVPFLWWLSEWTGLSVYREKGLEVLELLPAEKNRIVQQWREKGLGAVSAAESQGLIELKNELCDRKQCLNCRIGMHLLRN